MALLKCKECGNEISTKAESCPKCGAKTGPSKAGSTNIGCGALILGAFIVVIFAGIFSPDDSTTTSTPTSSAPSAHVGDDVVLSVSSGDVVVCVSKEAYDKFVKLAVAKDYLGMGQMEVAGQLFRVPSGTKAKIIDSGFERRQVRIMEGASFGRAGWITESITR